MKKHTLEKMTLEKLSRMIERGFEETATKKELQALREEVGVGFQSVREEMDQRFQGVTNQIDALHSEFAEVKAVLPPLVRTMAQFEIEVISLRERVNRIEKKIGLSKR